MCSVSLCVHRLGVRAAISWYLTGRVRSHLAHFPHVLAVLLISLTHKHPFSLLLSILFTLGVREKKEKEKISPINTDALGSSFFRHNYQVAMAET